MRFAEMGKHIITVLKNSIPDMVRFFFFHFFIVVLGYIVTFTEVLRMYQIYRS
jgi:hypothetical protein